MNEKTYLKFGNKMAYGTGDMATNFCYGVITGFMLIYLTDTVGLNSGIVGTLMIISRVLDGITDVLAGTMIDRTHSKWGKARPYIFWTIFPIAICEFLLFSTPVMSQVLQYAYFFVIYTVLNDFFFTANNVAYSTLSALITANKNERVQLGVYRFAFATLGSLVTSALTMAMVNGFGGGVVGWRWTALIYSVVFVVLDLICFAGNKELSEAELEMGTDQESEQPQQKTNLFQNLKYVFTNPYFVQQLLIGTLYNLLNNIAAAVGIYYMTYRLGAPAMLATFQLTTVFPLVIGLALTPALVKRFGIYKVNLYSMAISTLGCVPFAIFGMQGKVALMLVFSVVRWFCAAPMIANGNAIQAEIAGYSYRKDKVHIEGSVFSCNSMGSKIGQGLGTAGAGWLLALAHYDGTLAVQPASAINMISLMYAVLPLIITAIMTVLLYFQKVEKANEMLDQQAKA
ncbi:MAG: MFS transporter [Lachnospiraceae bacterium]|nr:MFS transporter [Lachnospiraceae bacterium]